MSTTKTKTKKITRARWTNAEIARLSNLYHRYSNQEIAKRLGRTATAVMAQANRLCLSKSAAYLSKMGTENITARWS